MNPLGALAGACAAVSVLLIVVHVLAGRPDPVERSIPGSRRNPIPDVIAPVLHRWEVWLGADALEADLRVLQLAPETVRRRQVPIGLASVVAALTVMVVTGGGPVAAGLAVVAACTGGLVGHHRWITRSAAIRREVIGAQVAEASEMIALAVTAGRAPADAFAIAADTVPEPLRSQLLEVCQRIGRGERLESALDAAQVWLRVREFDRLANTLSTAATRGVPLAATLLAHVTDIRAIRQAQELQRAGRREIAMLIPIVLVILPCVVLVALLPGAMALFSMQL